MNRVKATMPLLVLLALVAGCKSALDVYESKAKAAVVVSTNTNGTLSLASRAASSDVVLITGAVQRVDLPMINSPAIGGDNATCVLLVPARSIPAHQDIRRVALHYDNHGWLRGLRAGTQLVLQFQKDGGFDGVQFPANPVQPNGPATGRQPISSQINQPSAAAGSSH